MQKKTFGTRQASAHSDTLQLMQRGKALHNEAVFAALAGIVIRVAGLFRGRDSAAAEGAAPTRVRTEGDFASLAGQDR